MTFPGSAVDNLDDLMDDELRRRLDARGVDVAALVRNVHRSAYVPQTLFTLDEADGTRGVRVWLE